MKVLVTGSSGQIGSHVVDLARQEGHAVIGLDLLPSKWTKQVGDIRKASDCETAASGIDAVIHCAAHIYVQESIREPGSDATSNVIGTINMLEAAVNEGVSRFVNVSSAAVYGNPDYVPVDEGHPLRPLNPYGASKAAAEVFGDVYRRLHHLEVVTARPFNVYSERQDAANPYSGVISRFFEHARQGKALVIYGDGRQTRDFVHARDVAKGLVFFATADLPAETVLNLGTGKATSVAALARLVVEATGGTGKVEYDFAREGDIRESIAEASRAATAGWTAAVPLEIGITEMARSWFSNS